MSSLTPAVSRWDMVNGSEKRHWRFMSDPWTNKTWWQHTQSPFVTLSRHVYSPPDYQCPGWDFTIYNRGAIVASGTYYSPLNQAKRFALIQARFTLQSEAE